MSNDVTYQQELRATLEKASAEKLVTVLLFVKELLAEQERSSNVRPFLSA